MSKSPGAKPSRCGRRQSQSNTNLSFSFRFYALSSGRGALSFFFLSDIVVVDNENAQCASRSFTRNMSVASFTVHTPLFSAFFAFRLTFRLLLGICWWRLTLFLWLASASASTLKAQAVLFCAPIQRITRQPGSFSHPSSLIPPNFSGSCPPLVLPGSNRVLRLPRWLVGWLVRLLFTSPVNRM
jgi:hypothetical protein